MSNTATMCLNDWRNKHAGRTAVVIGCGPSTQSVTGKVSSFVTIGVNDAARWVDLDYLLVIDGKPGFVKKKRWEPIASFPPDRLFRNSGHLRHWPEEEGHTLFEVRSGKDWRLIDGCLDGTGTCGNALYLQYTSPMAAVCLAYRMGCRQIGMIGVDFVDHPLSANVAKLNIAFRELHARLQKRGCDLWNLSDQSALTMVPRLDLDELAKK